ncbi:MAG: flagellar protein FlaG [Clostridiaceae bacterium]|nr:flagellar protein FlaG [Clostridia bacterium]MDD3438641.1 flagellar protein FlaG [Clostridiaceae bacterium]
MKIAGNSISPAVSSDTMRNNAVKGNHAEISNRNNAVKSGEQEVSAKPKDESEINEYQFIRAVETANKALEGSFTSFEISVHEKTNRIMVKVVDKETKEVIREIPPEKILNLMAKLWEMAGIIVDERR